jgi:hypothetical protein
VFANHLEQNSDELSERKLAELYEQSGPGDDGALLERQYDAHALRFCLQAHKVRVVHYTELTYIMRLP